MVAIAIQCQPTADTSVINSVELFERQERVICETESVCALST